MDTRKKFMVVFTICTVLSALVFLSGLGVFDSAESSEETTQLSASDNLVLQEETYVASSGTTLMQNQPDPLYSLSEWIQIIGGIAGMIAGILGVRAYELDIVTERRELMQYPNDA